MGLPKSVSVCLLALVLLTTLVSITVFTAVLYTAIHPLREQTVNNTDPTDLWRSGDCSERPLDRYIAVEGECEVLYHTNDRINTSLINIGSCSRQTCQAVLGPCGSTGDLRCCCQPTSMTNLQYQCGSQPPLLYDNAVRTCGCRPCLILLPVIGMLVSSSGAPARWTIITINGSDISTDINGMFGLMVSGLEDRLNFAMDIPFLPLNIPLQIVPGTVNAFEIQMTEMVSMLSIVPIDATVDIQMNQSSIVMGSVTDNSSIGTVFIHFLSDSFQKEEEYRFSSIMVDLSEDIEENATFMIRESFVTGYRDINKRSTSDESKSLSLWAAMLFKLVISDEDGLSSQSPVEVNVSMLFNAYDFPVDHLEQLKLYSYEDHLQGYQQASGLPNMTQYSEDKIMLQFTNVMLNADTFVAGLPENDTCYAVTRVFLDKGWEHPCLVEYLTRQPEPFSGMVNFHRKYSGECVPVPCSGQMVISIDDPINYYTPPRIVYDHELEVVDHSSGPLYRSQRDCESIGKHSSNSNHFFRFIRKSYFTKTPPKSLYKFIEETDSNCFVKIQILSCPGHFIRVVTTSKHATKDYPTVEYLSPADNDDSATTGSAVSCDQPHTVCMLYTCGGAGVPVNVSVSQCTADNCPNYDSSFCFSKTVSHSSSRTDSFFDVDSPNLVNQAPPLSSWFLFHSNDIGRGLYHSDASSDIAFYQCELNPITAMTFQCNMEPDENELENK